jgi:DNA-binding CsgD family transcriptional regulator
MERRVVNGRKHFQLDHGTESGFSVRPKAFNVCDKRTGTQRFEVQAGADGSMPADQMLSLLALHCVLRGQAPEDFSVMVAAGEDLLDGLGPRAEKVIEAFMATRLPVQLTARQQEVLRGVLQNLSNKEIAMRLNVAVRTVKFHVAGLLAKFGVTDRVGLMRQTSDLLSAGRTSSEAHGFRRGAGEEQGATPGPTDR